MTKTATFELLGPADLGRDEDWWHIGWLSDMRALCGEYCTEDGGPITENPPGRTCPDCVRIARARGWL